MRSSSRREVARGDLLAHLARVARSVDALNTIMEQSELLASNPLLVRSIRNRFPYLDPLNHVQVELLKLHRAHAASEKVLTGHPVDDQRHFGGVAQQRVSDGAAEASQPVLSWTGLVDVPRRWGVAAGGFALCSLNLFELFPRQSSVYSRPMARWPRSTAGSCSCCNCRLGLSRARLLRRLQGLPRRPAAADSSQPRVKAPQPHRSASAMSSRWIISARPGVPRDRAMSRELRPRMRSARGAS